MAVKVLKSLIGAFIIIMQLEISSWLFCLCALLLMDFYLQAFYILFDFTLLVPPGKLFEFSLACLPSPATCHDTTLLKIKLD